MNISPTQCMHPQFPQNGDVFPKGTTFKLKLGFKDKDIGELPASIELYAACPQGPYLQFFFPDPVGPEIWNHTGTITSLESAEFWFINNFEIFASRLKNEGGDVITLRAVCAPFYESEAYDVGAPLGAFESARSGFLAGTRP
jgi:hypothetical protein